MTQMRYFSHGFCPQKDSPLWRLVVVTSLEVERLSEAAAVKLVETFSGYFDPQIYSLFWPVRIGSLVLIIDRCKLLPHWFLPTLKCFISTTQTHLKSFQSDWGRGKSFGSESIFFFFFFIQKSSLSAAEPCYTILKRLPFRKSSVVLI